MNEATEPGISWWMCGMMALTFALPAVVIA